jgi:hypothetical protein
MKIRPVHVDRWTYRRIDRKTDTMKLRVRFPPPPRNFANVPKDIQSKLGIVIVIAFLSPRPHTKNGTVGENKHDLSIQKLLKISPTGSTYNSRRPQSSQYSNYAKGLMTDNSFDSRKGQ